MSELDWVPEPVVTHLSENVFECLTSFRLRYTAMRMYLEEHEDRGTLDAAVLHPNWAQAPLERLLTS